MDLQMPKLDGWAAIRELRSRAATATIPVVVLTGHDFKAYLKPAAIAAGAVSYLMSLASPSSSRTSQRAPRGAPCPNRPRAVAATTSWLRGVPRGR